MPQAIGGSLHCQSRIVTSTVSKTVSGGGADEDNSGNPLVETLLCNEFCP